MEISVDEWNDSQDHEARFWSSVENGMQEQSHRWGWYRDVCFPHWLRNADFAGRRLIDVGSGPVGVLHHVGGAARKVATDPLMTRFMLAGYPVAAMGVDVFDIEGEDLSSIGEQFDVAFCLNALDHCRDPAAVLRAISGVLARHGTFALCVDMREPETIDALHKLRITEEWTRQAIADAGMRIDWSANVPHQKPTKTVQFCAICTKEG